ncbi:spermine/spermidine synthase domain-containing protein [Pseudaminobacter sp. NGMCC 1.201702]|uniref:spermine/spermidine synthase domain-containing protein n=1 Tax=Pseudaminobacter sp. NGMCC 1.201702 TaxID=3391825 RepID=UPI0039EEC953
MLTALFVSGSLLLLIAMRFPPEWAAWLGALTFTTFNGSLISLNWSHLIGDPNPFIVFLFGGLLMLPVLAWSALFPVMTRLMTARIDDAGKSFARLYSLYTVGNVLGTFAFGLWLLPSVGTGLSLTITACIVAAGILFVARLGSGRILVATSAGLALALLIPRDYYRQFHLGGYEVERVYEGRNGVATTVPTSTFYKIIDMNRTASASAMVRDPGPGDQYEAWRWNLTELLALDPGFRPRRILIIGIGHAYLIDALLDLPFVEKIDIVDISEEVVEAVRDNTTTSTRRIFEDSRVQIIIEDGRRFVQQALAAGGNYDLIQTKINEPWHAGSGNLFTVEFMRLQRNLLTEGGYLGVRPLLGHARDGLQVFEAALYPGYYHVYFKNGALPPLNRATVTPDISDAWFKRFPGREEKSERADHLDVLVLDRSSDLTAIDLNTDDRPTFEYYKLRQWRGTWESPRKSLSDGDFASMLRAVPVVVDLD